MAIASSQGGWKMHSVTITMEEEDKLNQEEASGLCYILVCYWLMRVGADKYCMISLACGVFKKYNKLIDTENSLGVARGGGISRRWSKGTNFQLQDK